MLKIMIINNYFNKIEKTKDLLTNIFLLLFQDNVFDNLLNKFSSNNLNR